MGGQIASQTVEKGKTVTKPNNPQKDGYLFIEWQISDGKPFNFDTAIISNITLKAAYYKLETVSSFEELQLALSSEGSKYITLNQDINVTSTIYATGNNKFILDMNGKTISNSNEIWNEELGDWSLISVRENAELTITGNGTFDSLENDCYALDIYDVGGKLTIENGTYKGNIHAIYVYEGALYVKGGEYSIKQISNQIGKPYEFVLNCYDSSYENEKASIIVSGGTFYNFNPEANGAESNDKSTNFLSEGYIAIEKEYAGYSKYTVFAPEDIIDSNPETISNFTQLLKIALQTTSDSSLQNTSIAGKTVYTYNQYTNTLEEDIDILLNGTMIQYIDESSNYVAILDFTEKDSYIQNNKIPKIYAKVASNDSSSKIITLIVDNKLIDCSE